MIFNRKGSFPLTFENFSQAKADAEAALEQAATDAAKVHQSRAVTDGAEIHQSQKEETVEVQESQIQQSHSIAYSGMVQEMCNLTHRWHRRFFALENGQLKVYKIDDLHQTDGIYVWQDCEPLKVILLAGVWVENESSGHHHRKQHTLFHSKKQAFYFVLFTQDHYVDCKVELETSRLEWVTHLAGAAAAARFE